MQMPSPMAAINAIPTTTMTTMIAVLRGAFVVVVVEFPVLPVPKFVPEPVVVVGEVKSFVGEAIVSIPLGCAVFCVAVAPLPALVIEPSINIGSLAVAQPSEVSVNGPFRLAESSYGTHHGASEPLYFRLISGTDQSNRIVHHHTMSESMYILRSRCSHRDSHRLASGRELDKYASLQSSGRRCSRRIHCEHLPDSCSQQDMR